MNTLNELSFNQRIHVLDDRELKVLYYCLMNVAVNSFILVPVNNALSQIIFVQYGARFQKPD